MPEEERSKSLTSTFKTSLFRYQSGDVTPASEVSSRPGSSAATAADRELDLKASAGPPPPRPGQPPNPPSKTISAPTSPMKEKKATFFGKVIDRDEHY